MPLLRTMPRGRTTGGKTYLACESIEQRLSNDGRVLEPKCVDWAYHNDENDDDDDADDDDDTHDDDSGDDDAGVG